jgi:hypothetical protein
MVRRASVVAMTVPGMIWPVLAGRNEIAGVAGPDRNGSDYFRSLFSLVVEIDVSD